MEIDEIKEEIKITDEKIKKQLELKEELRLKKKHKKELKDKKKKLKSLSFRNLWGV